MRTRCREAELTQGGRPAVEDGDEATVRRRRPGGHGERAWRRLAGSGVAQLWTSRLQIKADKINRKGSDFGLMQGRTISIGKRSREQTNEAAPQIM
jgi:hypothetical protein